MRAHTPGINVHTRTHARTPPSRTTTPTTTSLHTLRIPCDTTSSRSSSVLRAASVRALRVCPLCVCVCDLLYFHFIPDIISIYNKYVQNRHTLYTYICIARFLPVCARPFSRSYRPDADSTVTGYERVPAQPSELVDFACHADNRVFGYRFGDAPSVGGDPLTGSCGPPQPDIGRFAGACGVRLTAGPRTEHTVTQTRALTSRPLLRGTPANDEEHVEK